LKKVTPEPEPLDDGIEEYSFTDKDYDDKEKFESKLKIKRKWYKK